MSALIPPPPQIMVPVAYGGADGTAAAAKGSYGPVIAMLAVLAVLAAAAVAVGRLCFGRRGLGQAGAGGHDLEAWVERTCGTCVGAGMFSSAAAAEGDIAEEEDGVAAAEQPPQEEEEREGGTERGEGSGSGGAS